MLLLLSLLYLFDLRQNTNLSWNQNDNIVSLDDNRMKQYLCASSQVPSHIRRELEFLLLLEELGSEGIPETVLKVNIILTFVCWWQSGKNDKIMIRDFLGFYDWDRLFHCCTCRDIIQAWDNDLSAGVASGLFGSTVWTKDSRWFKNNRSCCRVLPTNLIGEKEAQAGPVFITFLTGRVKNTRTIERHKIITEISTIPTM